MSLRLNVPALEDKPAIVAITRPGQIQEMIAGLPMGNPRAAARLLLDELERHNRQYVSNDQRVTALELFRPTVNQIIGSLARQYCHQPLPLQETARAQAEITQQLLTELAFGYKHAILAEEDRLFTLGNNDQLALLLQRTIETLGRRLQVYYQTYTPAPAGIWAELHQLYLHALQRSLQSLSIPDTTVETSINLVYKHALLLAMANPSHLNSTDIDRVIDYLDRYARLAQLYPLSSPEIKSGAFVVHLKSDTPPVPLLKNRHDSDARTDILMITIELARQVHQHLSHLQKRDDPEHLNLPPDAIEDPAYLDVLLHLLRQWGNPPKRIFNRSEKNSGIDICIGLTATHYHLANDRHSGNLLPAGNSEDITVNVVDSPIDNGNTTIFKSARWVVVNESPGGLSLTKRSGAPESLRIGELLGLKPDDTGHWGLAVVRWAINGEDVPLQIGVQMIAPGATAAFIRIGEDAHPEPVLLLPELLSLNQPATLIAPRSIYKPARTITLEQGSHQEQILLTRLVERTQSFERFQFSRL